MGSLIVYTIFKLHGAGKTWVPSLCTLSSNYMGPAKHGFPHCVRYLQSTWGRQNMDSLIVYAIFKLHGASKTWVPSSTHAIIKLHGSC
jgi:hypothetical protein